MELRSHAIALDPGVLIRATGTGGVFRGEKLEHVRLIGPGTIEAPEGSSEPIVQLTASSGLEVRSVQFTARGAPALALRDCRDARLDQVTIRGDRDGLRLHACSDVSVTNARIAVDGEPIRITGGRAGIDIRDSVLGARAR